MTLRAMSKLPIILNVVAGLGFLVALFWFLSPSPTLGDVDSLIKKELPIGCSKDQVYSFLEARAIASGAYNVGPDPFLGLPMQERERKRYVTGWIPVSSSLPFVPSYHISIVFYFDEEQNLSGYNLQKLDDVP
jgi:hypothetical protein